LVERPEDWLWSSFRHYFTGMDGVVEIESRWTERRREKLGIMPTARIRENPAQAKLERGTLKSSLGG
jgi:putative transposase